MQERIINIHADGKLAYTGYISLAAKRLHTSEVALAVCASTGRNIPDRQPRLTFSDGDGAVRYRQRAQNYIASFRQ